MVVVVVVVVIYCLLVLFMKYIEESLEIEIEVADYYWHSFAYLFVFLSFLL